MSENLKAQLQKFVDETDPKQIGRSIKKYPELLNWLNEVEGAESTSEKIYLRLNDYNPICDNGNRKKFESITKGYKMCGPAGKCACKSAVISAKSRAVHKTKEEQDEINRKRMNTVQQRFGVINIGQLQVKQVSRSK